MIIIIVWVIRWSPRGVVKKKVLFFRYVKWMCCVKRFVLSRVCWVVLSSWFPNVLRFVMLLVRVSGVIVKWKCAC